MADESVGDILNILLMHSIHLDESRFNTSNGGDCDSVKFNSIPLQHEALDRTSFPTHVTDTIVLNFPHEHAADSGTAQEIQNMCCGIQPRSHTCG